jgi:hypothetical protein
MQRNSASLSREFKHRSPRGKVLGLYGLARQETQGTDPKRRWYGNDARCKPDKLQRLAFFITAEGSA